MAPPLVAMRSRLMPAILPAAPRHVCILRLSAIGDTCHALAVVRTLQHAWPQAKFTWVIGRLEATLMGLAPDIEFIAFDKRGGLAEYRRVAGLLRRRRFDVLLHMQLAIRASLAAAQVPARRRIGFDRARAREGVRPARLFRRRPGRAAQRSP